MRIFPLLGLIAGALILPAHAQQSPAPAPASGSAAPASADAVRDALKKKEGDADQTELLKQTLTAVDKQYSMLKRGTLQVTYDLNYAYIGQERINALDPPTSTSTSTSTGSLFNIVNDSSHTITNTLSADYGLRDNLTGNLSLPILSKYSLNPAVGGVSNGIGDLSLGARFQPMESQRGMPSLTVTGSVRLPTGRSPFKVPAEQGVATGSGVTAFSAGLNVNHIVDPVALFGSLNLGASLPATHLSQIRSGAVLTRVAPGPSFGFGMGFAYALSYGISTSFALQESISAGSKLTFLDGSKIKTAVGTSSVLNLGLGYRISPKTTINTTVGIGLTADSPNFTIDVSLPLAF